MGEFRFFLSWSGPKSKEISIVLRDFLIDALRLSDRQIFLSAKDCHGDWYNTICRSVSESAIIIPCITNENTKSPWLYFETGIGSFVNDILLKKGIIPIVFDLSKAEFQDLPVFFNRYQMAICDNIDLASCENMLKNLIFQVSCYICENSVCEYYRNVPEVIKFNNNNDIRIERLYRDEINSAAKNILLISNKYDLRDMFFSRPIMGVDKDVSNQIEELFAEIKLRTKLNIYYSNTEKDFGTSISSYRIGIIKQCQTFVLVYLNDNQKSRPSSCLIELGAALALGKRIVIYTQKGTQIPMFFNDLKEQISCYEEFTDIEELREKMLILTSIEVD